MSADNLEALLSQLPADQLAFLKWQQDWLATARPNQIPPEKGWTEHGWMAGRGFGKTRVGAEWLGRVAFECPHGLPRCVVAPTQNDVRYTCFEGVSGLLNVIPAECVREYNKSDLILTLTNGATIRGFSAEKSARLRGPEHADAWCDEIAAWGKDAIDTLDMLKFGLRIGPGPRLVWTSTPKPVQIVRELTVPKAGRIVTVGATFDNVDNLSDTFIDGLAEYEGTKIGRQELYGELIDPEEAGIVKRSNFNLWSAKLDLPKFEWIVMSLDTAFTEKTLDSKGDPDPTACGVWGVFAHQGMGHVMLLDAWEEHLGFPDLLRRVKKESKNRYGDDQDEAVIKPLIGSRKLATSGRKPDIVLIEEKGSGISLVQSLAAAGIMAHTYNPGRADKLARLHAVSPIFASRRVWLPESRKTPGRPMSWCEPVVSQLCSFAGEKSIKHDDHVDQTTQAIRLMMDKNLLRVTREPARQQHHAGRERRKSVNPYAQ